METNNKLIIRHVFIAISLYIVATFVISLFFIERYQAQKQLYSDYQLSAASMELETLKAAYSTTARTAFNLAINTEKISSIMDLASSTQDLVRQDAARKELYKELWPMYQKLEKNNLRQLHFHLPGSISFLRFHRPEKHGDSLVGIRPTIDAVNQTKKEAHGFEEGRIFNGFRHVFPLFYHDRFVGSVELSYSFDAIRELAFQLYPAQYDIILKQSVIDDKVFDDERDNYVSSVYDGFAHDKRLKPAYQKFSSDKVHQMNVLALSEEKIDLSNARNQLQEIELDAQGYLVAYHALKNFQGEHVGYLISYKKDQFYRLLFKNFQANMILAAVLNFVMSLLISVFLYRLAIQKQQLQKMATIDTLTGIANRSSLETIMAGWMHSADRYDESLSLIFFDIDHFKEINDRFGHHAGDEALKDVCAIVASRLRESDYFGRWGGEEFIILLPKTSLEEAHAIAEVLRVKIAEHPFQHGTMSSSFGISEYERQESMESFIARADTRLYKAKNQGRNCVISS